MQFKIKSVAAASTLIDLKIFKEKSNILKYNTENNNPVTLDGEALGQVDTSMYLGSINNEQRRSNADVKARNCKASTAFLQLKNILNSEQLLANIKARIFYTNIMKVLLYGA